MLLWMRQITKKDRLFTEHGPRIYSDSYKNAKSLLSDMGISFNEIFTPYHFTMSNIGGPALSHFSTKEKLKIVWEYIKFFINTDHGKSTPVAEYLSNNNFSEKAKDFVNRLCHLSDGAGSDRYRVGYPKDDLCSS